eukprot:GAHX01000891.1.p1 GENE.GAHX01000891.1~~GAHX01000891.1.p1  ORF type:complete len:623 (+),score=136.04 GAHX01000891.1:54-1922(+)
MNLKELLKENFKKSIIDTCKEVRGEQNFKLVLDEVTTKMISSCLTMSELTYYGVPAISDIFSPKTKLKFSPIYFIDSCRESIKQLVEHYIKNLSKVLEKKKKPRKRSDCVKAYLFFTNRVSEEDFDLIKLIPIKYVLCLYETGINYLSLEERVFSVPTTDTTPGTVSEINQSIQTLVSLSKQLNTKPVIGYRPRDEIAQRMAENILEHLKDHEFIASPKQKPTLLLILDRLEDLPACLVHQFTYQSILYDLLDVDFLNRVKLPGKDERSSLNPTKETWIKYRHSHIAKVSKKMYEELNLFTKEDKETRDKLDKRLHKTDDNNSGYKTANVHRTSFEELQAVVRAIPKQQEKSKDYQSHLTIISALFEGIDENNISNIAKLEQYLTTNITTKLERFSLNTFLKKAKEVVKAKPLGSLNKYRLVLLTGLYIYSDKEELFNKEMKQVIDCFELEDELGERITKFIKKAFGRIKMVSETPNYTKESLLDTFAKILETEEFEFMVWKSKLFYTLSNILKATRISNKDTKLKLEFEGVLKEVENEINLRKIRMKRKDNNSEKHVSDLERLNFDLNEFKIVVFVRENITYAEVKDVYDLGIEKGIPILIGSKTLCTSNKFITNLLGVKE